MAIVEFLEARYAEEEVLALAVKPAGRGDAALAWFVSETSIGDQTGYVVAYQVGGEAPREHIARHDPAHVLADIASKRALVAELRPYCWGDHGKPACGACDRLGCRSLRHLAAPYKNHPDFQEVWV